MKKIIGLTLCVLMAFSISSCSYISYLLADTMKLEQMYVKGILDSWYKGVCDEEYLKFVDITAADALQSCEDSLLVEADFFAYYWGMYLTELGESFDILSDEIQEEIIELCREMYKHVKYEVVSSAKIEDNSYAVKVVVYPVNLVSLAVESYTAQGYAPLDNFYAEHENTDIDAMSDAEYAAYTEQFASIIIQMVMEQLPNIGYMEEKSCMIQVDIVDGYYTVNEDDINEIDWYVIDYPG